MGNDRFIFLCRNAGRPACGILSQAQRSAVFIESYHPRTFHERGVSAPFTTPLLAGARLRGAPSRGGHILEVIIPNPAGGRGVYILPWGERGDLCRPTVHDTRLGDALAIRGDLASLCPAMVRHAGWVVAAEGHAGHAAAVTAGLVLHDAAARFAIASSRLESALARIGGGTASEPAARERLAGLLANIHAPEGDPARLPQLIDAVGALATALPDWAAAQSGPESAVAQVVGTAAGLVHGSAVYLLRAAIGQLDDPAKLLRDWLGDAAGVEQALSRADWLLDGWHRLVLLWQSAQPGPAAAALEMAALLPVWPDEAEAWLALPAGTAARMARRPGLLARIRLAGQWSHQAIAVDQIARNERLRALGL